MRKNGYAPNTTKISLFILRFINMVPNLLQHDCLDVYEKEWVCTQYNKDFFVHTEIYID